MVFFVFFFVFFQENFENLFRLKLFFHGVTFYFFLSSVHFLCDKEAISNIEQ